MARTEPSGSPYSSGGDEPRTRRALARAECQYYEPWTYDYETLIHSPRREHQSVARPRSAMTGEWIDSPIWGPNWDDDLAGGRAIAPRDPNVRGLQEHIAFEYEQTFMMYLPRICEHCLNPSCVASCPVGAIYKRDDDGIVLVDQETCRGWRFCISGCPYKKMYFNWNTHKAEKCTFCYPRIEVGLPTVCSETCVGRIRYLGVVLYDADRVFEAASVANPHDLYQAQLDVFLDPRDPEVMLAAREAGINDAWIEAAQHSPIYKLAMDWRVALPLHPEYRTLPMVWYVPSLSPIMNHLAHEEQMSDELGGKDQRRDEHPRDIANPSSRRPGDTTRRRGRRPRCPRVGRAAAYAICR